MQEIVALALNDGAHRVEQGLLTLLEHLDEHAGALIGILNLLFLFVFFHTQGSSALVAVIHQDVAVADLQGRDIVAQGHCQAARFFFQFHIKVGCHLLAAVGA